MIKQAKIENYEINLDEEGLLIVLSDNQEVWRKEGVEVPEFDVILDLVVSSVSNGIPVVVQLNSYDGRSASERYTDLPEDIEAFLHQVKDLGGKITLEHIQGFKSDPEAFKKLRELKEKLSVSMDESGESIVLKDFWNILHEVESIVLEKKVSESIDSDKYYVVNPDNMNVVKGPFDTTSEADEWCEKNNYDGHIWKGNGILEAKLSKKVSDTKDPERKMRIKEVIKKFWMKEFTWEEFVNVLPGYATIDDINECFKELKEEMKG